MDEEFFGEKLTRCGIAVHRAGGLHQANFQELPGIVPFVYGMADIEAFVALKTDQLCFETGSQNLCDFRFPNTGFTFQQ